MESGYRLMVGIDWATEAHPVCVLDSQGRLLEQRRVEHRAEAIAAMIDRLIGLAGLWSRPWSSEAFMSSRSIQSNSTVSAIATRWPEPRMTGETPSCWPIHSGRIFPPSAVSIWTMPYPQLLRLCPSADQPWLLALIKLAPTPTKAQRLRRSSIERLLHQYRIRKWTADQVRTELKTTPLSVAPGVTEATCAHIALLLPRMELLMAQHKLCSKAVQTALNERISAEQQRREHRDVDILLSLPGVARVLAATMLAEASQLLAQRNYHALRTLGGIAPVTRQSGKRSAVPRRYGCNHRLGNAFYHWPRV